MKSFPSILHPEDRDRTINTWKHSVETGEAYEIENRSLGGDGVYHWFHNRGLPLRDTQGRIVRWYKLSTDIDDRKKAEEVLRTSQAELAHVARVISMSELTASIAHEVNDPLAAVVTNGHACLRWLNRDIPDLTEVRSAVELMVQEAIRGSEVIARIRALMKKEPPVRQRLDVNEVVREIISLVPMQVPRPILRIETANNLPNAIADRVQLQQVLLNLIGNAVEAMKTVTDRPRELRIRTASEPDSILIEVRDNGVGVDAAHLKRLFEPFYTTKTNGLGMGLAITRSIVESHGGRLWAESNVGPGMTFRFTLPSANGGGA